MCRSGPAAVVTASRNAVTCGFRTRLAIVRPAAVYGMTTRSAPASLSFFSASSSEARATIWMSGRTRARRQRDVEVVGVVVGGDDDAGRAVEAGAPQVLVVRRVALDQEVAVLLRGGDVASGLKSSTTYDTPAARNSSAT